MSSLLTSQKLRTKRKGGELAWGGILQEACVSDGKWGEEGKNDTARGHQKG